MTEPAACKIESQDLSVGALFKGFYSVPDYADLTAIATGLQLPSRSAKIC